MDEETETVSVDRKAIEALVVQALESYHAAHEPAPPPPPQFSAPLFWESPSDGLSIYGDPSQVAELFTALAKAKGDFKPIPKNKTVEVKKDGRLLYSFKYAEMGPINEATETALSANGITVMQPPSRTTRDTVVLHTMVLHCSGAFMVSEWKLGHEGSLKDIAGDLTLTQRYAYSKTFNLATDEDADEMQGQQEEAPQDAPKGRGKRAAPKPKAAPKPAGEGDPGPQDADAPSVSQLPPPIPVEAKKPPSARARPAPKDNGEPQLRTDEQMALIEELRGEVGIASKSALAKIVVEVSGVDPRKGEPFTVEAADKTIAKLREMLPDA